MVETLEKYEVPTYDPNHFNKGRIGCIKASMKDFPIIYNNMAPKGLTDINTIYLLLSSSNQMPGGVHIGMFMKCI